MRRLIIVLAVLLGLAYAFGIPLMLQRDDDPLPSSADAVVVLSGSQDTLPVGKALVDGGRAQRLVVTIDRSKRDTGRATICRKPAANVTCIQAGPAGTLGEARVVSDMAVQHHWDSIVLVAPRYSLLRAGRIFNRCVNTEIIERGVDEPWWRDAISIPLEWIRLGVSETVRRRC